MIKKCALILLIGLSISLVGCQKEQQNEGSEKEVTLIVKSIGNTTNEKFSVIKSNALQLLKHKHKVELTRSNFIKCIDNVCVKNEYSWTFYVNNKLSLISADKYYPKDGDILEFGFGG